ncbi:hypothetical protein I203_100305 [Kwoniella mangroviensis CBS 8507]|uniref:uncharacterized protein n=1 Tax=Kwoniella mangroviensis CBS 8507 TaxID=1296122 RepID=UPI00301F8EDA
MPKDTFNLPEYFALHSYLSALICGAFVLLPRSTPWFVGDVVQSSSTDRPEYAFLTPLTSRPLVTMVWDILGMLICMSWWGSIMRRWSQAAPSRATVANEEAINERTSRNKRMLNPWSSYRQSSPTYFSTLPTHIYPHRRPETPLERALVYPVIGTLSGAWCGAIPIPLDWDRPWQNYPLTPTVGSILGFIVGGFVSWLHSALIDTVDEVLQTKEQVGNTSSEKKKKKRTKRT